MQDFHLCAYTVKLSGDQTIVTQGQSHLAKLACQAWSNIPSGSDCFSIINILQ